MLLTLIASALVLPGWVNLVLTILPILGFLGALFGWYQSYQKNQRESTKEEEAQRDKEKKEATDLEARKQALVQFQSKTEERFTGLVLEMDRRSDEVERRFKEVEKETSTIPNLRDLLGRLETRIELNGKGQDRIEAKLDRFLESFHKS